MLKGSLAVRRSSSPTSPMRTRASFPPIAIDSLHHHPINNHNSHQHMSRVKASSRSASSSDSSCSSAGSSRLSSAPQDGSPDGSPDSPAKTDKDTEEECLAPRRFVERYSLPRVVRVVNGQRQKPMTGPLAQPLLLYRQYSTRKVAARSLQRDGKNMGTEVGPPMVIPDSYQDATCGISRSAVTAAVSPGVIDSGISLGFHGGRRLQYVRTTVRGGHVLRLVAVFEDTHHAGRSSTRERGLAFLGGRGSSTNGDVHGPQYAQCLTHRNEEIFVPVSTSGQFFVVNCAEPGMSEPDLSKVYQLPQLLRLTSEPLPVKVQLVCGPVQAPLPPGFTGLLLLESVQRDDVILACTLPRSWALPSSPPVASANSTLSAGSDGTTETPPAEHVANSGSQNSSASTEKPILLEMDADSRFLLMRPLSSREAEMRFFKTPLVQRVVSYCRERAELWCSQIKVTHHIFPSSPVKALGSEEKEKAVLPLCNAKRVLPPKPPASSADVSSSSGNRCGIAWGGTKKSASFRYASSAQVAPPCSISPGSSGPSLLQQLRSRLLHRTCSSPNQEDALHISDIFPELRGERPAQSVPSSRQLLRFYADELPYANVADAITSDGKAPKHNKNSNQNHHKLFHHHHFEDNVDDDEDENIYAEICECPRNSVISGAKVILRTTCSTERSGYFTFQSANSAGSCYLRLGGSDGTLSGTMSSSNPSNPEEESVYDTVC